MSEGQIDHLWGEGQGQTMSPSSIPSRRFRRLILWVLICFFLSGMTGLMYELLWTRMIVKIIGGAPFAVTIILTVFMGGQVSIRSRSNSTRTMTRTTPAGSASSRTTAAYCAANGISSKYLPSVMVG